MSSKRNTIGGFRGRVAIPFLSSESFTPKRSFLLFLWLQSHFLDRMVDKSSPWEAVTPFQKFLDPPMNTTCKFSGFLFIFKVWLWSGFTVFKNNIALCSKFPLPLWSACRWSLLVLIKAADTFKLQVLDLLRPMGLILLHRCSQNMCKVRPAYYKLRMQIFWRFPSWIDEWPILRTNRIKRMSFQCPHRHSLNLVDSQYRSLVD